MARWLGIDLCAGICSSLFGGWPLAIHQPSRWTAFEFEWDGTHDLRICVMHVRKRETGRYHDNPPGAIRICLPTEYLWSTLSAFAVYFALFPSRSIHGHRPGNS